MLTKRDVKGRFFGAGGGLAAEEDQVVIVIASDGDPVDLAAGLGSFGVAGAQGKVRAESAAEVFVADDQLQIFVLYRGGEVGFEHVEAVLYGG